MGELEELLTGVIWPVLHRLIDHSTLNLNDKDELHGVLDQAAAPPAPPEAPAAPPAAPEPSAGSTTL